MDLRHHMNLDHTLLIQISATGYQQGRFEEGKRKKKKKANN
jgi:hypothetical protein